MPKYTDGSFDYKVPIPVQVEPLPARLAKSSEREYLWHRMRSAKNLQQTLRYFQSLDASHALLIYGIAFTEARRRSNMPPYPSAPFGYEDIATTLADYLDWCLSGPGWRTCPIIPAPSRGSYGG